LLLFIVEQNLVRISAVMLSVIYCRLGLHMMHRRAITWIHDVVHKTGST